MNQNGKTKLIISGALAVILVTATLITLIVLRREKPAEETAVSLNLEITYSTESNAENVPQASSQTDSGMSDYSSYPLNTPSECQAVIDAYAADHGIDPLTYPIDMVNLLSTNPDTLDFVLHYPENAGTQDGPEYPGSIDMSGVFTTVRVPEY